MFAENTGTGKTEIINKYLNGLDKNNWWNDYQKHRYVILHFYRYITTRNRTSTARIYFL